MEATQVLVESLQEELPNAVAALKLSGLELTNAIVEVFGLWTDLTEGILERAASSAGRSLSKVWTDPGLCFNLSEATTTAEDNAVLPINNVLDCLRKIRLNQDFAVTAVEAYRDAFAAGYGYYYYNSDVLESAPLKNPYSWEIFNGSSGGQVNYEKVFNELIEEIRKDGADGTLSYRITDIITQARDAHSGPVDWPLGTLNLIQTSSDAPVWLNLRLKEGSSEVEVVGNVIGLNGTGVAETKVVTTINGEDALLFLKDLTTNTAIGLSSQFRSPGVRMNVFLAMQKPTASVPRWSSSRTGDISKLPARLEIEYEDGSSTTWAFAIPVPSNLALLPTGELAQSLQTPAGGDSGPLALYNNMVQGRPAPKQMIVTAKENSVDTDVLRDYFIFPGSLGNGSNTLGFDIFIDRTQDPPVTFSGYTVVNEDTMVWKLPTFANPSSPDDVVNFWNVMVMEAENQGITKLIIDISNNGGGRIANAYTAVGLLYPDAPYNDVVHWYTTRISDVMLTLADTFVNFEAITETMASKKNVDIIESYLKDVDVGDFKEGVRSILEVLRNAAYLAASTGSCKDFSASSLAGCLNNGGNDRNWVNVNYTSMSDLLTITQDVLDSDEDSADASKSDLIDLLSTFLDRLRTAINRPSYCASINEMCKTRTNKQGGVEVLSSDYFKSPAMDEDTLKLVRSDSKGNPFKSYVLLSNAQLVGSAANIFESALRHISRKYSDTMPKTKGVSIGCLGDASQCDMTSFQGQIASGPRFVGSLYAMYGILSALQQTVDLFPDSVVSELQGISKQDIREYRQATERYLAKLPKPPTISSTIPQYNSLPIYSLELSKETIPQEFFNRPPEGYLPIWPAPQSTSFEKQSSLPEIYQELQQFF
ncbi:hypothetical protein M9435_004470 [Picochlorum sp. BPE23]|nr:hypothetical protein M9435_004470 [Picochlorum sp. BPE23]